MAEKTNKAPSSCGVDHSTLRKLGTGVYEDATGQSAHFCLDEILEEVGLPRTPENLDICEAMLREAVDEKWPGVPVLVTPDRSPRGRGH